MSDFGNELAKLVAAELHDARRRGDNERMAEMLERLLHSTALTISVMAVGSSRMASTLVDGASAYLVEEATGLQPLGSVISP